MIPVQTMPERDALSNHAMYILSLVYLGVAAGRYNYKTYMWFIVYGTIPHAHDCVSEWFMISWFIKSYLAEFILGNIKMYLHFVSLLNTEIAQEVEILLHGRRGTVYLAYSMVRLLVTRRKEAPGQQ